MLFGHFRNFGISYVGAYIEVELLSRTIQDFESRQCHRCRSLWLRTDVRLNLAIHRHGQVQFGTRSRKGSQIHIFGRNMQPHVVFLIYLTRFLHFGPGLRHVFFQFHHVAQRFVNLLGNQFVALRKSQIGHRRHRHVYTHRRDLWFLNPLITRTGGFRYQFPVFINADGRFVGQRNASVGFVVVAHSHPEFFYLPGKTSPKFQRNTVFNYIVVDGKCKWLRFPHLHSQIFVGQIAAVENQTVHFGVHSCFQLFYINFHFQWQFRKGGFHFGGDVRFPWLFDLQPAFTRAERNQGNSRCYNNV